MESLPFLARLDPCADLLPPKNDDPPNKSPNMSEKSKSEKSNPPAFPPAAPSWKAA